MRAARITDEAATTCRTLCTIRGFHERGISQLSFSTTGDVLITVGMDEHNTVALYDWSSGIDSLAVVAADGRDEEEVAELLLSGQDVIGPTLVAGAPAHAPRK